MISSKDCLNVAIQLKKRLLYGLFEHHNYLEVKSSSLAKIWQSKTIKGRVLIEVVSPQVQQLHGMEIFNLVLKVTYNLVIIILTFEGYNDQLD